MGVYLLLNEAESGGQRPYLILIGFLLLLGAPATSVATAVIARAVRGMVPPPEDPPRDDTEGRA